VYNLPLKYRYVQKKKKNYTHKINDAKQKKVVDISEEEEEEEYDNIIYIVVSCLNYSSSMDFGYFVPK
jgi:hypothetical protein